MEFDYENFRLLYVNIQKDFESLYQKFAFCSDGRLTSEHELIETVMNLNRHVLSTLRTLDAVLNENEAVYHNPVTGMSRLYRKDTISCVL